MRKLSRASLAAAVLLGLPIAPLIGAAAAADRCANASCASSPLKQLAPPHKLRLVDCRSDFLACAKGCSAMATYSAGNTSLDGYKACARSCDSDKNQCDVSSKNLRQSEPQSPEQNGPQPSPG